ncbi:putative steroid reductase DET2 [Morus notabilis]|uniref:Steroid 5-alpha-reductase DET2 n=1 Tax=Morus notabilis TaxID=981085 RepID=W9S5J5_9ROSA|nr:steroid 5-alpha-reductase DET2 [Morus notabilis]EXB89961.1 putative steroid reductase DET2 [Morus notabilis]
MESDQTLFRYSLLTLYLIGPPTTISLRFIQAPYGKHRRPGWGPTMSPPLAWFVMESPTLWLTLLLFPIGRHASDLRSLSLITPFLLHYLHRTLIHPIRISLASAPKPSSDFPVAVAAMAFGFNLLNAFVQTRSVSHYEDYGGDNTFWWRFAAGLAVFLAGMVVNIRSDRALLRLKRETGGGGGYKVPRGGWFEVVSCPNYFGEIVEWLGWAVMTWSWAGLGFFLYTCANLVPRARANHRWYLEKFGDEYPKGRKAVIPFLF